MAVIKKVIKGAPNGIPYRSRGFDPPPWTTQILIKSLPIQS